jgi:enolase
MFFAIIKKMVEKYKIKKIRAREIFDSRRNPTIEVELTMEGGGIFCSSVPSGASTGKYEAKELRDADGRGVKKAIRNINEIITPALKKESLINQEKIDKILIQLDGTENKSRLGANAILPVSMAVCRAIASAKEIPLYQYIAQLAEVRDPLILPKPCFNIINGGAHAKSGLDFQEFMVVPQEKIFSKNLKIGIKIYNELKKIIEEKFGKSGTKLGDEGGFVPPLKFPQEGIELILKSAENVGYKEKMKIILDVAASQFFKDGKYKTKMGEFNQEGLINYYDNLLRKYPIIGIEDAFAEEDWQGWKNFNSKFKSKLLIIGDDLLATNPKRIKMAKERQACNAVILKPNQIGTVSEAIEAAKLAKSFGWKIIVSHRSGETEDDFIADLAVGIGAEFIKSGAPFPKERMAKYNRLVKIEEGLHSVTKF